MLYRLSYKGERSRTLRERGPVRQLTPATAELQATLPVLNPAIQAGTQTLARTPVLNANLQKLLEAVQQLALAPATNATGLDIPLNTLDDR